MLRLLRRLIRRLLGRNDPATVPAPTSTSLRPRPPKWATPARPRVFAGPLETPQHLATIAVHGARRPRPDRIGLVGFHDRGFVIARPAEPFAPWLLERSQRLHDNLAGMTNIAAGLRQALELLIAVPRGIHRKIWLLSDGAPNREVESILPTVHACYAAHVNINTIGFGDHYDESVLGAIAANTHNGRFVSVHGLRELTRALVGDGSSGAHPRFQRSETTILVIDLSYSMDEPMEGRTKIAVVEEAIHHLIHYKQRLCS